MPLLHGLRFSTQPSLHTYRNIMPGFCSIPFGTVVPNPLSLFSKHLKDLSAQEKNQFSHTTIFRMSKFILKGRGGPARLTLAFCVNLGTGPSTGILRTVCPGDLLELDVKLSAQIFLHLGQAGLRGFHLLLKYV